MKSSLGLDVSWISATIYTAKRRLIAEAATRKIFARRLLLHYLCANVIRNGAVRACDEMSRDICEVRSVRLAGGGFCESAF